MFKPKLFDATPEHVRVYGLYERIYTTVDLSAALMFVVGSICFFYKSLMTTGTWLFLIGSFCFAAAPGRAFPARVPPQPTAASRGRSAIR